MRCHTVLPALCPVHGSPTNRQTCTGCNAGYMRVYMRRARRRHPVRALLCRAKQRARDNGINYSLSPQDICLPINCPVLGNPLVVGGPRSDWSPSLDRIAPEFGYAPGNVRVISDRANRLKGGRSLAQIMVLSRIGRPANRADYSAIARYMEREALLIEVKRKAGEGGPGNPWSRIAAFLELKFRNFFDNASDR